MLDWISGLTSALRNAGEVIYGEYLAWLYRTVFGAIAEFFTQMSRSEEHTSELQSH